MALVIAAYNDHSIVVGMDIMGCRMVIPLLELGNTPRHRCLEQLAAYDNTILQDKDYPKHDIVLGKELFSYYIA